MGMGEPLHNYDAVMKALRILADEHGLAVNPRRVTLSTVGVLPALERLATEPLMPNLAISLHATTEEQRDLLVPINRKYGLKELLDACRRFPVKRRERITFEYVMLKDVNDTDEDARRLVRLLNGIKAKVNLLPLNEAAGIPYERPSDARVNRFAQIVAERGLDGLGPQVARPRHPRRLRSADYGIHSPEIGRAAPGDLDAGLKFTSRPGPPYPPWSRHSINNRRAWTLGTCTSLAAPVSRMPLHGARGGYSGARPVAPRRGCPFRVPRRHRRAADAGQGR